MLGFLVRCTVPDTRTRGCITQDHAAGHLCRCSFVEVQRAREGLGGTSPHAQGCTFRCVVRGMYRIASLGRQQSPRCGKTDTFRSTMLPREWTMRVTGISFFQGDSTGTEDGLNCVRSFEYEPRARRGRRRGVASRHRPRVVGSSRLPPRWRDHSPSCSGAARACLREPWCNAM